MSVGGARGRTGRRSCRLLPELVAHRQRAREGRRGSGGWTRSLTMSYSVRDGRQDGESYSDSSTAQSSLLHSHHNNKCSE